jgi:phosphatidylinositol glycan class T
MPQIASRQSIVGVPLSIQRFLTGGGQSRGGLSILITNKDPTQDLEVVYLESMPWFIKFYLHTLTSSVHGEKRS